MSISPTIAQATAMTKSAQTAHGHAARRRVRRRFLQAQRGGQEGGFVGQPLGPASSWRTAQAAAKTSR